MDIIKRFKTAVRFLYDFLCNPASHTYYPQAEHKSGLRIVFDNFWWLIRYREINHFYYMYGLDRKGASLAGYLPKKPFCRLRDKINARAKIGGRIANYNCLVQDKFIFGKLLKCLGFPTPEIIALCDNNSIFWFDKNKAEPFDSLLGHDKLDVFIKEILGERAEGVFHLYVDRSKLYLDGKESTVADLQRIIADNKFIIQQRIIQHQKMSELYPGSVNTIRFITALKAGRPIPLAAMVRLGASGCRCDNLAIGGVAVGINLDTGTLFPEGVFKPGFGGRCNCHPDTKVKFENFQIPYFKQAVDLALKLHGFFYGTHSVGWDIAITFYGPMFIEGNNSWEIPTLQFFDRDLQKKYFATLTS